MISRSTDVRAALRGRQRGFLLNPYSFGAAATDPNFANVSLLINPDGANASTTFVDLSSNANTLTAVGNAQHSTTDPKFTSSNIRCDGTGDTVTAPTGTIFDFGGGHYTLEAWIFVIQFTTTAFFTKRANSTVFTPFYFYIDGGTNKLGYLSSANGSSWGIILEASTALGSPSVWYHVAVDFDGTTTRLYQDGVVKATSTTVQTMMTNTNAVSIGAGAADASQSFNGRIGPCRITKGVARYAGAFTPPTAAFPTS